MPAPLKLFDLFPNLPDTWRFDQVPASQTDDLTWLATLNEAVVLHNLRTVAASDGIAFDCEFEVLGLVNSGGPGLVIPRNGFLAFQIRPVRGFEFRLLNTAGTKRGRLFVRLDNDGKAEILLEGLPVELVLPPDLVSKYFDLDPANNSPEQSAPNLADTTDALLKFDQQPDAQVVVLKDMTLESGMTSVFTHLRMHVQPGF